MLVLVGIYGYRMPRKDDWFSRMLGLKITGALSRLCRYRCCSKKFTMRPAFARRSHRAGGRCAPLNARGVGMKTIQKLMGHRHIGTTSLYCDVSDETLRNAVELL